uniref:Solute carrier family 15 member 1 n=1 Tax=Lygus hesperus TaxID=30085 RepID=A0A0A9Z2Z9_LYGHE
MPVDDNSPAAQVQLAYEPSEYADPAKPFHPSDYPAYSIKELPKRVFLIVANEAGERFCFYGFRANLAVYCKNVLGYSETTATSIYGYFISFSYLTPLLGGYISDSYLGFFKTIVPFSLAYIVGMAMLGCSAYLAHPRLLALLSLALIGLGTGGIKPCVSSFGCSQIVSDNPNALTTFFNIFYFAINFGSIFGAVTPSITKAVGYGPAFFVSCGVLLAATLILISGYSFYVHKNPEGSMLVKLIQLIYYAFKRRRVSTPFEREELLRMKAAS